MPLLSQFLLTSICGILTRLRRAIPRSTSLRLISCQSPWNDFTASSDVFIALGNLGKANPSQFVLLCLAISRLMPVQRKRRVFRCYQRCVERSCNIGSPDTCDFCQSCCDSEE